MVCCIQDALSWKKVFYQGVCQYNCYLDAECECIKHCSLLRNFRKPPCLVSEQCGACPGAKVSADRKGESPREKSVHFP